MPPKPLAIPAKEKLVFDMRLAIAAKRPIDAIDAAKAFVDDPKTASTIDTAVAYLICTAYRTALAPLRKAKLPSIPNGPADVVTVASMQHTFDVAIDWLSLCRDARDIIARILASNESAEIVLLLKIEEADFLRYEIDATVILNLSSSSELIDKVGVAYEQLANNANFQGLSPSHYLRLRLCINYAIFVAEKQGNRGRAMALAREHLEAIENDQVKKKQSKNVMFADPNELTSIAHWPVLSSEILRLKKKVEDIRLRYSPLVAN